MDSSRDITPDSEPSNSVSGVKVALVYIAVVVVGILLFLLIRYLGQGLVAPPPEIQPGIGTAPKPSGWHSNVLAQILLGMVVILIAARGLGAIFRYFGQAAVIGEVVAGILLGPSLLGRLSPATMDFLFPASAIPVLGIVSQVGILLFMFLIGVELNTDRLRDRAQVTFAISHASIICPFLLGSALALALYPRFSSQDVSFTAFALFIGVSMSVTAFPVLARILMDRKLHRTRMGGIAMTCAAFGDVTAWCLLAFVVGVVQARLSGAALIVFLTLCYIAAMFFLAGPLMQRLIAKHETGEALPQSTMAILCAALLLSCLATEMIGIHALFGAFLLGAIIPHDSRVGRTLIDKLEDFIIVLLLPSFFAFTGLRTQLGLIVGAEQWLFCGLIIVVATVGKFGGSVVAGRLTGLSWRDASGLGILMNTRGLMELIVLNVGLDLGVISPRLFAMLVVMAVVTTFATTPILDRLVRGRWHEEIDETSVA